MITVHNGAMRWKRVLMIGAVAVVIGGAGAMSAALLTYHEATKIDRSNPKVVTDEYLRAALVRKDKVGAQLYACAQPERLVAIQALRDELDRREREFGVSITIDW